jgi:hypothetical protein
MQSRIFRQSIPPESRSFYLETAARPAVAPYRCDDMPRKFAKEKF